MRSKIYILCLFCLFSVSCVSAQPAAVREKQSDRQIMGLKGAVKKLEIIAKPYYGFKDVYLFNEAGNIIEHSQVYRKDNRVSSKSLTFYDNSGRKIRTEHFKEDKVLQVTSVFEYSDRENSVTEIGSDAAGNAISKNSKKYNESGKLIETNFTFLKPFLGPFQLVGVGAGSFKKVYKYDENGNLIEEDSFTNDSEISDGKKTYVYNKKGLKIEEIEIKPPVVGIETPRVSKLFFKYDNQGNIIETTRVEPSNVKNEPPRIFKSFHKVNNHEDIAETRGYEPLNESNVKNVKDQFKVIDSKGTVQNGLLISDKPNMILWNIRICEWEYDSQGNWLRPNCKSKGRDSKDFKQLSDEETQRIIIYF